MDQPPTLVLFRSEDSQFAKYFGGSETLDAAAFKVDVVWIATSNQPASLSHRVCINFRGYDRDRKRGHSQHKRIRSDLFLAAKQESVFPDFREGRLRGDHFFDLGMVEYKACSTADHGREQRVSVGC